jgi:hypothetical protein
MTLVSARGHLNFLLGAVKASARQERGSGAALALRMVMMRERRQCTSAPKYVPLQKLTLFCSICFMNSEPRKGSKSTCATVALKIGDVRVTVP